MMHLQVRLFGRCRELVGVDRIQLQLPEKASVQMALDVLRERHPKLNELADRLLVAVNEEYVDRSKALSDGDTLAVFPPVSGGANEDVFELTRGPIDVRGLVSRLLRHRDGAVVLFEGVVRDHSLGKAVLYLEYEAYEPMALRMMQRIGHEVHEKWPIDRLGIVHRLGRVEIGQTSVAIAVTSVHRRVAFEACQYAIDRLKKIVPIWKREFFEDGSRWVEGEPDEVSRRGVEASSPENMSG